MARRECTRQAGRGACFSMHTMGPRTLQGRHRREVGDEGSQERRSTGGIAEECSRNRRDGMGMSQEVVIAQQGSGAGGVRKWWARPAMHVYNAMP